MLSQISDRMRSRSAALLLTIDNRLDLILKYWLLVAGFASAARSHTASHGSHGELLDFRLLHAGGRRAIRVDVARAAVVLGRAFAVAADDEAGSCRPMANVNRAEAERHPLYGTNGIMVSLLVGMMLNVPIREPNISRDAADPSCVPAGCRCCTSP